MDQEKTIAIIDSISKDQGLDSNLCQAIAYVETGIDPTKVRYEAKFNYLVNPQKYSKMLGITQDTEIQLQRISWGPMQIMGACARTLGYSGTLVLLVQPQLGVLYACKQLKMLCAKFKNELDVISAYNQGAPIKINNEYRNKYYVQIVEERLSYLRGGK